MSRNRFKAKVIVNIILYVSFFEFPVFNMNAAIHYPSLFHMPTFSLTGEGLYNVTKPLAKLFSACEAMFEYNKAVGLAFVGMLSRIS